MPVYTYELLKKCLEKDGAIIDPDFDHSNSKRGDTINFICSCNTKDKKSFRRIYENGGAYCELCTNANNTKKGAETRNNNLTEEEKTAKEENTILEAKEKEIEILRRKERDEIIKNKPDPTKWYPHPIYKNYEANTEGEVRNAKRNKLIEGTSYKDGRTTITIYTHKKQKHRFIIEALFNKVISDDYEIDHIDQNPGNNKFVNLLILTISEHAKKTADTNPGRGKKATLNSSIKVIRTDTEGKSETRYDSLNDASKKSGHTKKTIKKYIKNGQKDQEGFRWSEIAESENDLPNEIWKYHPVHEGLKVSNFGRIRNTTVAKAYNTYGSKGEYYTISYKAKQYRVHKLVCETFNGPSSNQEETVDHIDNDKYNNNSENLRWASKITQAQNRTNVNAVEVYDINTLKTMCIFHTQTDLAKKYEISEGTVSDIVNLIQRNGKIRYSFYRNLSIRKANMSNEEKIAREEKILKYDLDVLLRDKNKRKTNDENLPVHITKTKSTYVLNITFKGTKYRKCGNNIDDLILAKETWIKNKENEYINKIKTNISQYVFG